VGDIVFHSVHMSGVILKHFTRNGVLANVLRKKQGAVSPSPINSPANKQLCE